DDTAEIPAGYRDSARIDSLPTLDVYRGEFSKVRRSFADVKPQKPRPADVSMAGRLKAVVYTAEWCTACRSAKKLLRSLGVTVDERDIDKDALAVAELASIAGQDAAIPVTIIGKKVIGGYDEAELRKAVEALKAQ
ncbi:MAG: glutaredoxin family protein, partial [Deltaproteobacteria bacterium]|nr:glutaredoxin family protein [Deltaproteobacteria bacterium]